MKHSQRHPISARRVARRRTRLCAFGLLAALGAAACATTPARVLPPLTPEPTGRVAAGKFVWHDLVTQDAKAAQRFYGALFGWTFDSVEGYTRVLHEGEPIAGIVSAKKAEDGSEWLGNLSVADVDIAVATAIANGAIIEREPIDVPQRGRMALVSDPEGALLLLLRASTGDPLDTQPAVGGWLWREIWSNTPSSAETFYTALVGYAHESVELEGQPYDVFESDGVPRAGIVHAPDEIRPTWLPYVRVADASAIAERAEQLGARVFTQTESMAIIIDPTGAPFAVQVWEPRPSPADDTGSGSERKGGQQ